MGVGDCGWRVSGYGRRGTKSFWPGIHHPAGALVKIIIQGRKGSGRSSVAAIIEKALREHVIDVRNEDDDQVGVIQGMANLKAIRHDCTIVIESKTVKT